MTALTSFILAAILLVVVTLAILLPSLLRTPKVSRAVDRKEANLDIFRDQLSELERDRNEGSLAEVAVSYTHLAHQQRAKWIAVARPAAIAQAMLISLAFGCLTAAFVELSLIHI